MRKAGTDRCIRKRRSRASTGGFEAACGFSRQLQMHITRGTVAPMPRPEPVRFDLEQHAFFWLTQTIGSRDRRLSQELRDFGLRVPEWRVLASLCARRRCSMSELADLATIDRTTLTRTVDRMENAGWATRLNDATDLRVTRLAPTASGERLFARIWPTVERLNRIAIEGLPPGAVDTLRRTLERMKTNLDQRPAATNKRAA
jgi:DNA-binding MarR family transcriptional regulator